MAPRGPRRYARNATSTTMAKSAMAEAINGPLFEPPFVVGPPAGVGRPKLGRGSRPLSLERASDGLGPRLGIGRPAPGSMGSGLASPPPVGSKLYQPTPGK